jgi:hypothetical protein
VAIADEAAARRGDLSKVAVLGTAHLSALPKDFDPRRLAGLLDKLAAWKPEKIAVESLSGPQCDYLKAYAFAYPDTWKTYCRDPSDARAALRLDGAAAEAEIERTLATVAVDRPAANRRRLAALFFAVGEPTSAMVQWLRLPAGERRSDDVLPQVLVDELRKLETKRSENYLIAVPLAVRLGHERVYPVDDHTGDRAGGPTDDLFEPEILAIWKNDAVSARRSLDEEWDKRLAAGGDVLSWYRWMNSKESAVLAVTGDFGAAAGAKVPGNSGREYLAYWETRNMRMVANIREAVGPGCTRLLAIVGASHKAYYERYLGVSSDIEIADIDQILK